MQRLPRERRSAVAETFTPALHTEWTEDTGHDQHGGTEARGPGRRPGPTPAFGRRYERKGDPKI